MLFAALQQLVQPSLAGLDASAPPQREALATAVGLRRGDSPQTFLIALAVLDLLSEASVERPDAPRRRGRPLARRPDRRGAGLRGAPPRPRADAGAPHRAGRPDGAHRAARLPELELSGLDDESAGRLLTRTRRGCRRAPVRECSSSRTGTRWRCSSCRSPRSTSPRSTCRSRNGSSGRSPSGSTSCHGPRARPSSSPRSTRAATSRRRSRPPRCSKAKRGPSRRSPRPRRRGSCCSTAAASASVTRSSEPRWAPRRRPPTAARRTRRWPARTRPTLIEGLAPSGGARRTRRVRRVAPRGRGRPRGAPRRTLLLGCGARAGRGADAGRDAPRHPAGAGGRGGVRPRPPLPRPRAAGTGPVARARRGAARACRVHRRHLRRRELDG